MTMAAIMDLGFFNNSLFITRLRGSVVLFDFAN